MPCWPTLMSRVTPVSTVSPFLSLSLYFSISSSVLPALSFLFYICLCFSLISLHLSISR